VYALEESLAGFDSTQPEVAKYMRLQADTLQRLSDVSAELQKYRQLFGDLGNQTPVVAQLVAQLRQKDAELEKLQLVARELEAVCEAFPTPLLKLMAFQESVFYIFRAGPTRTSVGVIR
jgi:E3 ubiquitin-protein ligase BRE1